jgi:hypothetical protein
MATITISDPARLYPLLLNTGLQSKNNPLYQVLHELINSAVGTTQSITVINGGGGSVTPVVVVDPAWVKWMLT